MRIETPIAFIIFNRPEKTRRVVEVLRELKPSKLFIIADGPRTEAEAPLVAETRAVIDTIDWECVIEKNYAPRNLGCGTRVSSGIDWVFEQVEQAIILEDDCLPDPSFFPYCAELLDRYRDDTRIMTVCGTNFQAKNKHFSCPESYYFSRIPQIWGWATWRRAWKHNDHAMRRWPDIQKHRTLRPLFPTEAVYAYWEYLFDQMYRKTTKKTDTWDAQWFLSCLLNEGIHIIPKYNLISNIGFDAQATRSTSIKDDRGKLVRHAMPMPLTHPSAVQINTNADDFTYRDFFRINKGLAKQARSFMRTYFPALHRALKSLK